jgi:hypothetical protein
MHDKYSYRFNARKIVDLLGGVQATKEIMCDAGCRIKSKTIAKWRERGNLPPDAFAVIVRHMASKGEQIPWAEYTEDIPDEEPR